MRGDRRVAAGLTGFVFGVVTTLAVLDFYTAISRRSVFHAVGGCAFAWFSMLAWRRMVR